MRSNNSILLLDDDESFLKIYARILNNKGYKTQTAEEGEVALKHLKEKYYPVVISDMVMPGMDGIDFLKKVKSRYPQTQVIMLTGEGSITGAVEAMKLGAFTYLVKPVNIDELLLNVERAFEFFDIHEENLKMKSQLEGVEDNSRLLGESPIIEEIRKEIVIAAASEATVLITGESGTGKEIAVNLLHQSSNRAKQPLIKVNCAALAESLLESELFGHEKGAFTGAHNIKIGRFELAHGGTLFLDEIGELTPNIQTKLLRVLQEKEFERVGGTNTIKTNFRLVTATNKDLAEAVKKGSFREDLYYRINVIPIHIPPLRERKEDIPYLLQHFLNQYSADMGKDIEGFSPEALRLLQEYTWPGNVRELRNLVERLVVFASGNQIGYKDLPEEIRRKKVGVAGDELLFRDAKRKFEEEFIWKALMRNEGNITATAKEIGMARKNLQLKMKELGLREGATNK